MSLTWPELIAMELAAREGDVPPPEPTHQPALCRGCGTQWACVAVDGGLDWCLSCWFRLRK
jgi:hypothetical protein